MNAKRRIRNASAELFAACDPEQLCLVLTTMQAILDALCEDGKGDTGHAHALRGRMSLLDEYIERQRAAIAKATP